MSDSTLEKPWYRDGLQFECTQCGNCCGGGPGHVFVSQTEIEAAAKLLNLTPDEFTQQHTRKIGWRRSLLELKNWDCEFLRPDSNGRKTCAIYEARPIQCRTWPFWKSNLQSRRAWESTSKGCPGVNTGSVHPLPVIQAALQANGALPL